MEAKNKAVWLEGKKGKTLTLHAYRQERYKWRPPLEEEYGNVSFMEPRSIRMITPVFERVRGQYYNP